MESNIILETAVIIISGILFGRLAKFAKLPNVTGYLIAGLLLGPSFLNVIPLSMVDGFSVISDIALAFIAFSVGSEFSLSYFRKVGTAPVVIAVCESFGAILLVIVGCVLLGFDPKLSIMLGAIAAATAPAQTIMVINQYKSRGPLTSMLLSVVALDDAVALIGFGIAATIVNVMSGKAGTNVVLSVLSPIYEILISFVIGIAASMLMKLLFRWFRKPSNMICIITGLLLFTYWVADKVNGSALLACMALGAVLANIVKDIDRVMDMVDALTPPIFIMFFVISGAGFDVSALSGIGIIGLLYVILRVLGKMAGSWAGGKLARQEDKICRYLGPTLMPQAGVALGLIVVASSLVPEYAPQIRTIILCSTFIYSIIGPSFARSALVRSGEIVLPPETKKRLSLPKLPRLPRLPHWSH